MLSRRILMATALAAMVACTSNPAPSPVAGAPSATRHEDVITAQELSAPGVASSNLLEAVQRLRPNFLVTRGAISIRNKNAGKVHVSYDGGPLYEVSTMTSYMPSTIAEVRHLTASDATQKFGIAANAGGVIIVKSK